MTTRTVASSLAWSIVPSSRIWFGMLIDARLQTATSSVLVLSVISVQRFELWITPLWSCGERTLHGSLKVIQGWPVSKSASIIRFQSASTRIFLAVTLPSSAISSYSR